MGTLATTIRSADLHNTKRAVVVLSDHGYCHVHGDPTSFSDIQRTFAIPKLLWLTKRMILMRLETVC